MIKNYMLIVLAFIVCVRVVIADRRKLISERDRYRQNTEILVDEIGRYKVDSAKNYAEVTGMRLTLEEFKRYRSEDIRQIKELKLDLKRLQASLQHKMTTDIPIDIKLRDTVIVRDTLLKAPHIKLENKHIDIDAIIVDNALRGHIRLDVNLQQYIYTIPKHRFLWFKWGVKGINQTIVSDNPYVKINYSQFIKITK